MSVSKEIPEFLLEMSKQLNTQDNRITAEPIFEVRCKRYLVTEQGYNESHWELHGRDSEGWPTYSTKGGFDNSDAHDEFYDANEGWCDQWLVENDFNPCLEDFIEHFDFEYQKNSYEDWPNDYNVVHMQEVEETVKSCLTEADANDFIVRKQHDYPKLYTYAQSMVFCPQMIELRQWIMGLTHEHN